MLVSSVVVMLVSLYKQWWILAVQLRSHFRTLDGNQGWGCQICIDCTWCLWHWVKPETSSFCSLWSKVLHVVSPQSVFRLFFVIFIQIPSFTLHLHQFDWWCSSPIQYNSPDIPLIWVVGTFLVSSNHHELKTLSISRYCTRWLIWKNQTDSAFVGPYLTTSTITQNFTHLFNLQSGWQSRIAHCILKQKVNATQTWVWYSQTRQLFMEWKLLN